MDETSGPGLVKIRGRGTAWNPPNRFEKIDFVPDLDEIGDDEPRPRTTFLRDASRSIIARNDSPDIPFTTSVNPYRGCEHGWLYSRFRRINNLRVPSVICGHVRYLSGSNPVIRSPQLRCSDERSGLARKAFISSPLGRDRPGDTADRAGTLCSGRARVRVPRLSPDVRMRVALHSWSHAITTGAA